MPGVAVMESQRPSRLWQDLSDQGKWDAMYGDRDNKEEDHDCDTVNHLSMALESLSEENPSSIVFDGFDSAIIGIGQQWGSPRVIAYSAEKIIDCLVSQGMDEDAAREWFDFNVACISVGSGTPFILQEIPGDDRQ